MTVATMANNTVRPTANIALPKTDFGSQETRGPGVSKASALSGARASATKRNHFNIGTTNRTASQDGNCADRRRLMHRMTPAQRNGSEANSKAASSRGVCAGERYWIPGKGWSKYENTDHFRPN